MLNRCVLNIVVNYYFKMDIRTILTMDMDGLKRKLTELTLSIIGRKHELQERLLQYFMDSNSPASIVQAVDLNVDDDNSEYEDAVLHPAPREVVTNSRQFTLNDIKDSVPCFGGTNSPDVNFWISEFEGNASIVGWDELQKCIYAKQLLTGAAKLFIKSQNNIRDWSSFKKALTDEFGKKLPSSEIHRMLRNRRKRAAESYYEYLYSLLEIAKPIALDEGSIIEYFVEGIPDTKMNKIVLYQAKSVSQLKEQIDVYEKVRGPLTQSSRNTTQPACTTDYRQESVRRCFKCGNETHLARDCPTNQVKCYKCGQAGHKSFACTRNADNQQPRNGNKNFNTVTEQQFGMDIGLIFKDIKIQNFTFNALVDTGCELCLMRCDKWVQLGKIQLNPDKRNLLGIGGYKFTTMGSFSAKVKIDDILLEMTFQVVKDRDLQFEAIIGSSVLREVEMVIRADGAKFKRIEINQEEELRNDVFQEEFQRICLSVEEQSADKKPELDLDHLRKEEAETISTMITKYKPIQDLKCPVEMKIVLTDDVPIFQRPRRMSHADRCDLDAQIKEWLSDNVIQPSTSEYASPVVLVSKKDGTKRLCCDFRKLNEKIVRDNFPMILIDDVLERLQGANIFSTLDLKNGFFHVPVELNSRKYTSFVTHSGQYEFLKVPFGISNSPAVFARFVSAVLRDLINDGTVLVYVDDIIIPSKDESEGIQKLKLLMKVAAANGLNIKWKKCQFLKRKIEFLGYIIEKGTIKPSVDKMKVVKNYVIPKDQKSLQRFLGLTSYFRRFIKDYAAIAKPLSDMLRKNVKYQIKEAQLIAF